MYGWPIALGAIAFPTNPASRMTVKTYGIPWINWTGIVPTIGNSTPCNLICKASVNPNNKQARRAVLGCHLPKINAATTY